MDRLSAAMSILGLAAMVAGGFAYAIASFRAKSVEAFKDAVAAKDDVICALETKITKMSEVIEDLKQRVVGLERERETYEQTLERVVSAVASAGVCDKAWDCLDRTIASIQREKSRGPRSRKEGA